MSMTKVNSKTRSEPWLAGRNSSSWRYCSKNINAMTLDHYSILIILCYGLHTMPCAFKTLCVCKIQNLQKRILKNAFLTATHPYNACNQLGVKLFSSKSCMNIHYTSTLHTANSKEC